MSTESPLTKQETQTSIFAGHLGHLTPDQESTLEAFKELLGEKELYKSHSVTDDPDSKPTHDDGTLLRFLRARKFEVQEAFQQFKDTEEWRKANQLDFLYDNIEINDYEETRRLYPQWTGRRDLRGIPVYVYEIKSLDSKRMAAYHKSASKTSTVKSDMKTQASAKLLRLFALYENLTQFVTPLCTRLLDRPCPEVPITQTNNIVDISGVGLGQFWNLRSHMQDASTLATAHYPETLDRIFVSSNYSHQPLTLLLHQVLTIVITQIIGAPSFFPVVWGWIKKWFDPITTSKIFILSAHEVKPTLTKFIDLANIPKKYGGELEYEFGMMPVLDAAAQDSLTWSTSGEANGDSGHKQKTFPIGPMRWVDQDITEANGDGEKAGQQKDLIAMGSVQGKERRQKIASQREPTAILPGDPGVQS
ncbi:MAG: hypothetical protein M4579_000876 [Chaenotheca gracillima]|nr:MAG: hypothetical protein M4579_000876 [Chaenotheca gracillima]